MRIDWRLQQEKICSDNNTKTQIQRHTTTHRNISIDRTSVCHQSHTRHKITNTKDVLSTFSGIRPLAIDPTTLDADDGRTHTARLCVVDCCCCCCLLCLIDLFFSFQIAQSRYRRRTERLCRADKKNTKTETETKRNETSKCRLTGSWWFCSQ